MVPEFVNRLIENMKSVIVAKPEVLELALVAVTLRGTYPDLRMCLASVRLPWLRPLARSLGCSFHRIQCTPDLLPSDITGIHFF